MCNRLAIGTVQFGLNYGIANQLGKVPFSDAQNILQLTLDHSIDTLDTAIAYGESESTLGRLGVNNWKVVTKLSAIPEGSIDVDGWVESQIEGSLCRLNIDQLHAVLLHQPEQLLGETGRQLFNALQNLKAKGLTKKIGISIYDPGELEALMSEMDFDLVQAPLNILDRRLVASGWASRLKTRGVELHVRSAFLQGLLLMPTDQRPAKFSRWQPVWEEWSRWQLETGLTPMQACLGYVLGVEEIDKVVVGVDSAMQLKEILDSVHSVLPNLPDWPMPIEPILINPSRWSQL